MSFDSYACLARILLASNHLRFITAHLLLLLDWNLTSQVNCAINEIIELIGMCNDSHKLR